MGCESALERSPNLFPRPRQSVVPCRRCRAPASPQTGATSAPQKALTVHFGNGFAGVHGCRNTRIALTIPESARQREFGRQAGSNGPSPGKRRCRRSERWCVSCSGGLGYSPPRRSIRDPPNLDSSVEYACTLRSVVTSHSMLRASCFG